MRIRTFLGRALRYIFYGVPIQVTKAQIFYTQPSKQLEGKKIIITGGGRGLGFSMAKKFIAEGAEVLIAGRNEETLIKSANTLKCKYLTLDISNTNEINTFLQKANELLGEADCLINNAGISLHEQDFTKVTSETFDQQIAINLKGSFFMAQKFIALLRAKNKKGNILFISSETGATVDDRPYGWTKAAINSMTQGLASKMIREEIRINGLAPGITASEMTGYDTEGNLFSGASPSGRIYLPEEVAEIACFLISDISSCISGQIIYCNNGKTLNTRW